MRSLPLYILEISTSTGSVVDTNNSTLIIFFAIFHIPTCKNWAKTYRFWRKRLFLTILTGYYGNPGIETAHITVHVDTIYQGICIRIKKYKYVLHTLDYLPIISHIRQFFMKFRDLENQTWLPWQRKSTNFIFKYILEESTERPFTWYHYHKNWISNNEIPWGVISTPLS